MTSCASVLLDVVMEHTGSSYEGERKNGRFLKNFVELFVRKLCL